MHILICDDHKIVRDGLKQILAQCGEAFTINEAANAGEVFELLNKATYELLLLDISLPDQNGLDILQKVK
jgi:DNA-binding NarL/FixJ family response regulator